MISMIQNSRNPQAMLQSLIQSNPKLQQMINYINKNGGNPKDAFYNMAKEKGIDPEEFLRTLGG